MYIIIMNLSSISKKFLQKNDLLYASCYIVTIKYIVENRTI